MPRSGTTGCDVRCGVPTAALDQATPEVAVAVVRLRDAAAGWLRGKGGGDDGAQNRSHGEPFVEIGTVGSHYGAGVRSRCTRPLKVPVRTSGREGHRVAMMGSTKICFPSWITNSRPCATRKTNTLPSSRPRASKPPAILRAGSVVAFAASARLIPR